MDVHPDAALPAALLAGAAANRLDDPTRSPASREAAVAQLRARLLRMIVANENASRPSPPEPAQRK